MSEAGGGAARRPSKAPWSPGKRRVWNSLKAVPGMTWWSGLRMREITVDFYCSEARVAVLIGQPPQFDERLTGFLSALDVELIAVSAGEVESDPVAVVARIAATCRRARSRRKPAGAARLQSRKVKSGRSPSRHEAQKIRLRSRWCGNEWVSPWNATDPCRRCRRIEWDPVCAACALRPVEMGRRTAAAARRFGPGCQTRSAPSRTSSGAASTVSGRWRSSGWTPEHFGDRRVATRVWVVADTLEAHRYGSRTYRWPRELNRTPGQARHPRSQDLGLAIRSWQRPPTFVRPTGLRHSSSCVICHPRSLRRCGTSAASGRSGDLGGEHVRIRTPLARPRRRAGQTLR